MPAQGLLGVIAAQVQPASSTPGSDWLQYGALGLLGLCIVGVLLVSLKLGPDFISAVNKLTEALAKLGDKVDTMGHDLEKAEERIVKAIEDRRAG